MQKKYCFYGWESADVKPIQTESKFTTPHVLYDALSSVWCAETCAPRMRDRWTEENKTFGQCSITAFLAQDIFGGKVYGIERDGGNYHCYNVVGDCVFDLTSEQFGEEKLNYDNHPEQFREVHFAKEEKRLRYEALKRKLYLQTSRTMFITDLDGTLLNSEDRVNPKSLEIINRLVEDGMLFTYATARSLTSAAVVTRGLQVKAPVIVYNGALIIQPDTKEVLYSLAFSPEEEEIARERFTQMQIQPIVYSYINQKESVSWDVTSENDGIRRYISKRKNDPRMRPLTGIANLFDGQNFYYTCIGEREKLLPVYKSFAEDKRFRCTLQQELYRPEYWCEIMPAKASKAEAIRMMKDLLHCERVISFGDAVNDIPMFEVSDVCYAVKNAVDELKSVATGVIESNEEDGVAVWLEQIGTNIPF